MVTMVVRDKGQNVKLSGLFVNASDLVVEPPASTIEELEEGKKNRLIVVAERKGPVKEFTSKRGYPCRISHIEIRDKEGGTITLVLFNSQIGMVAEGDMLEIINADLEEFNGEKTIKVSKFGYLKNKGPATKTTQMKFKEVE